MEGAIALASIALVLALVSIALRYWETPPEITRRVSSLETDLLEAVDSMSRWMKRENVRRARDSKENEPAPDVIVSGPMDNAKKKAQLRERARHRGLM